MASIAALASDAGMVVHWLLRTSAAAAAVAIVIALVQTVLSRRLTPAWRYRLWALLVLRLMLPVLPPSPTSIWNLARLLPHSFYTARAAPASITHFPPSATRASPTSRWETIVWEVADSAAPPQIEAAPTTTTVRHPNRFSFAMVATFLWGSVAILLLARLIIANVLLSRRLRRASIAGNPQLLALLQECCRRSGVRRIPRVLITRIVRAPATVGFVRPRILLPPGLLDSLTEDELGLVLLHELAHVRCRDVALNWLLAGLQIAHWFNPVLWWAMARLRSDREAARDAMVLRMTSIGNERARAADYGRTLMKLTEFVSKRPAFVPQPAITGMIEPTMSGMLGGRRSLRRRFIMIDEFSARSYRFSLLGPVLILTFACVALTDAKSAGTQPDEIPSTPASSQPSSRSGDSEASQHYRAVFHDAPNVEWFNGLTFSTDQPGDPLAVTPQERAVIAKLDRSLGTIEFESARLDDVIDFFRDASDANIFVNWKVLEAAGIERKMPVTARLKNVKLANALKSILDGIGREHAKLRYTIDEGTVVISTADDLSKNVIVRVYDIRDLLPGVPPSKPGGAAASTSQPTSRSSRQEVAHPTLPTRQDLVDSILRLIMDTVDTTSWKERGGSVGALRELQGQLIVTQTKENHRQIISVLQQLRQQRGSQVLIKIISLTADAVAIEQLANEQSIPASKPIIFHNSITPARSLRAWGNAEMISWPYVLCSPGQRATIQMSDNSHQYIAGYSVSRPPGGGIHFDPVDATAATTISLELTATPSSDGKQVQLVVHRMIRELLGFERTSWKGRPAGTDLEIQSPQFAVTDLQTTTSVPVGGLLLLASPEKSEPDRGAATPGESGPATQSAVKSRSLVLFITPILPKAVTE